MRAKVDFEFVRCLEDELKTMQDKISKSDFENLDLFVNAAVCSLHHALPTLFD